MPAQPLYQNVWTQGNHIYHTTNSGIDVYNSDASSLLYHVGLPNAATAVWADNTYIYMGTLTSGVYRSTISGAASPYRIEPNITSNETTYLHGAGEFLCVTTISGVDQYNVVSGTRIYTSISGATKCYQTSTGEFYYAVSVDLNAVYSTASNWSDPDYIYDDLLYATVINDIHVTEGTSSYNNNNIIFLGTDQGAHVIEERRGDEENANLKRYYIT